jgi:hypothetical protein
MTEPDYYVPDDPKFFLHLQGRPQMNQWVSMVRRSWMTGASIETTLELWASSLRDVKFAAGREGADARIIHAGACGSHVALTRPTQGRAAC